MLTLEGSVGVGGDGDGVDDDVVDGAVAGPGGDALHLVEHVEPLHDLAEQAVLRGQRRAVGAGDQEELAAVVFGPALAIATEPISYWPGWGSSSSNR